MVTNKIFYLQGFTIPLTTTMISEVTASTHRGRFLIVINFFVSIGKLYAFILAFVFLEDFSRGNWRMMMFISSLTSLMVSLLAKFFLYESPRLTNFNSIDIDFS